jgi:hypothetical protein
MTPPRLPTISQPAAINGLSTAPAEWAGRPPRADRCGVWRRLARRTILMVTFRASSSRLIGHGIRLAAPGHPRIRPASPPPEHLHVPLIFHPAAKSIHTNYPLENKACRPPRPQPLLYTNSGPTLCLPNVASDLPVPTAPAPAARRSPRAQPCADLFPQLHNLHFRRLAPAALSTQVAVED